MPRFPIATYATKLPTSHRGSYAGTALRSSEALLQDYRAVCLRLAARFPLERSEG
jgi:hypothetical protein